jgi:hypothetical protein
MIGGAAEDIAIESGQVLLGLDLGNLHQYRLATADAHPLGDKVRHLFGIAGAGIVTDYYFLHALASNQMSSV